MHAVPSRHLAPASTRSIASISLAPPLDGTAKVDIPVPPVFHLNFGRSLDPNEIVLQSSDNICFAFNRYRLAFLFPVFDGLFQIPPPPNITHNPVPITVCTSESLALCLTLIKEGMDHRGKTNVRWPTREVLSDLIEFVNAYDMPFVADELLARTSHILATRYHPPAVTNSQNEPFGAKFFDRYAFARATNSPYTPQERQATLGFDYHDISEWCEATLTKYDPLGLADLFKALLDIKTLHLELVKRTGHKRKRQQ
ncbi:hypothetical protein Q8F55_006080 [Vanrija albida]|uniref:BTB domain-containing protein n=1 Tax=Vanrija albida TaxID=181172 RepID=A0ABR3Q3Y1_9TREE